MDTVIIIVALLFTLVVFIVISLVAGASFRQWNEGEGWSSGENKSGAIKTAAIGAVIVIAIGILLFKCQG